MIIKNRKIGFSFNTYIIFLFSIILFISCVKSKEYDYVVEGLHYLDSSFVRIEIKDGKILDLKKIKHLSEKNNETIIAPGLIDNQVNGYKGFSFVDIGQELTKDGIKVITEGLWEAGVTTYLPTLTTNDHQIFLKNFELLAHVKNDTSLQGSIAGFHLEGPYISPVNGYRGAHPLIHVRYPDWDEFIELYNISQKNILQVTLAPEMEGALDFISKCKEINVKVGLAHHNSSSTQIAEAVNMGAAIATHIGNSLPNEINRWNNPIWPQLANDKLNISMICDGYHLTPEQVKVFYEVKGPDKTIITSDMSPLGGLTPGFYLNAIGDTLELKSEGVVVYPAQNSLSGSASTLSAMIGNVMKFTGCNLATAIKMSSTNVARLYGLNDRGEIKPGLRADLILFTMNDNRINIKKTIVKGKVMYDSSNQAVSY